MLRAQMSRIIAFAVAVVTLVVIPLTSDDPAAPSGVAGASKPEGVR